ncbi:MAG: hypothetical protein LH472_00850 [Pyrinomonadaceae bacterium]|nr:hypothetical protein [Pyrinomonadaceae bacterium]
MFKKIFGTGLLILAGLNAAAFAQEKTVVNDANARKMLLGKHLLSLQWISWDYFGAANVVNKHGVLYLKGEQRQRKGTDYVKVDGVITEINAQDFKFDGTIEMQISHINNGAPCQREGAMTFAVTGKRKYWRLQEMDNPCDAVTDYVDIYFRGK